MKTLINAFKGINKFGLALALAAVTLVATQSAFTAKRVGLYYYTPAMQQSWTAPGDPAPDQTAGNYQLIGSQDNQCSDVDVACTYDLIDGEFVFSTRARTNLVP